MKKMLGYSVIALALASVTWPMQKAASKRVSGRYCGSLCWSSRLSALLRAASSVAMRPIRPRDKIGSFNSPRLQSSTEV
jgi:hypothetical protein